MEISKSVMDVQACHGFHIMLSCPFNLKHLESYLNKIQMGLEGLKLFSLLLH